MINLLLFNNICPVISYRRVSKRKRRITVYGSVTRYGPQSIASVTWPNQVLSFSLSLSLSFFFRNDSHARARLLRFDVRTDDLKKQNRIEP